MNDFDFNNFIEVNFPVILASVSDKYYIKGGKCYNIFFKNKIKSPDWDLVATKDGHEKIKSLLENFASKMGLTLINNYNIDFNMYQYGFDNYFLDGNDPYFTDIVISEELNYITILDNNYMKFYDFVKDLILTYDSRSNNAKKYIEHITKPEKLNEIIKNLQIEYGLTFIDFLTFKNLPLIKLYLVTIDLLIKYFYSIEKNKIIIKIIETLNESKLDIEKYLENGDNNDINLYNNLLYKINELIVNIEENYEDEDEYEKNEDIIKLLEGYNEILNEISNYRLKTSDSSITLRKYKKTHERIGNVINISWEFLSNEYKIYLLKFCIEDEIILFDIDESCKVIGKCINNNTEIKIIKNTDKCIKQNISHEKIKEAGII